MQQTFGWARRALLVAGVALRAHVVNAQPTPVAVGVGMGVDVPVVDGGAALPVARLVAAAAPGNGLVEWRAIAGWRLGAGAVGPFSLAGQVWLPRELARIGPSRVLQVEIGGGVSAYGVGGVSPRVGAALGSGFRLAGPHVTAGFDIERHWATRDWVAILTVSVPWHGLTARGAPERAGAR